MKVQKTFKGDM